MINVIFQYLINKQYVYNYNLLYGYSGSPNWTVSSTSSYNFRFEYRYICDYIFDKNNERIAYVHRNYRYYNSY